MGAFKIGKELFVAEGPDIVRRVRDTGAAVFLDLKFHDIPNTVAKAVASAARLNVQMLTVHASGGTEMLRAAQAAADDAENTPLILGVTVLTSMNEADLTEIGIQKNPAQQVQHLATLATAAGLKGLVCSPKEITPLRAILSPRNSTHHSRHPPRRHRHRRPKKSPHSPSSHRSRCQLAGNRKTYLRRRKPTRRRRGNPRQFGRIGKMKSLKRG